MEICVDFLLDIMRIGDNFCFAAYRMASGRGRKRRRYSSSSSESSSSSDISSSTEESSEEDSCSDSSSSSSSYCSSPEGRPPRAADRTISTRVSSSVRRGPQDVRKELCPCKLCKGRVHQVGSKIRSHLGNHGRHDPQAYEVRSYFAVLGLYLHFELVIDGLQLSFPLTLIISIPSCNIFHSGLERVD